jgi:hypothetical protein
MEYQCSCDFSKLMTMPELGQAITHVAWEHGLGMASFWNGHLWLEPQPTSGTLSTRRMTKAEVESYKVVLELVYKFNNLVDDIDVLSK